VNALPSFADFFRALWKKDPFPWQTMLADQVKDEKFQGGFPDAVDLPTASGKTACLDIAVYALAAQAEKPLGERTAARRIWFVVDRRIVVDEAFDRAETLAEALENSQSEFVRAVAERLLKLRGLDSKKRPLAVGRLRGGVLRDDRWARIRSQAAIITRTVDQLGSRLLFRGFGHSALAAPIFAGLAGNDSLILLDEAHCAVPFLQTLRAVQMFRKPKWSEVANHTPFHVAVLSATPPGEDNGEKLVVFPASDEERTEALNHEMLQARLTASKRAVLKTVKAEDKLAAEIAAAAKDLALAGTMRVGVIVNRVARAAQIAEALKAQVSDKFDVQLLTGRIRSVERDVLVGEKLHPILHASSTVKLDRPLILVSTQCLEVGADFSFDALVTECASLDALRQRFGRLARLGKPEHSEAFIFVAEDALKESDPIYGDALRETWEFLWNPPPKGITNIENPGTKQEIRSVNFGFEALRTQLLPPEELKRLLAPAPDAPILLPAHLDLLNQTAPRPHPDPDIGIFLHGKGRKSADVRVAFRCDFDPERPQEWAEIASLCRPVSGEMFSVPLHRLRVWLRDTETEDKTGDVEGASDDSETVACKLTRQAKFLAYRGRDTANPSSNFAEIYPDSTILLPAPRNREGVEAVRKLGQALCERGLGSQKMDLWELANLKAGKPAALRIHRECLAPWLGENGCAPLRDLVELIETGEWLADELRDALAAVREWQPENTNDELPAWLHDICEKTKDFRCNDIAQHPGGGIVLRAKKSDATRDEMDYFSNDEDAGSEAPDSVPLADHCAQVAAAAEKLAHACLGPDLAPLTKAAGDWHDAGKLDRRFQEMLRGGAPDDGREPLGKSPRKPRSKAQDKAITEAAGLPEGFRHEMLSVQLAEQFCKATFSADERELFLHLIASHHGHARPFAPVREDVAPPAVGGKLAGATIDFSAEQRAALVPLYRLDSGVTDRFWQVVRRFGWWGLAYREAILRLADWYASEHPESEKPPQP